MPTSQPTQPELTVALKIRNAYSAIQNKPVGSWLPIAVEHNGVTQYFLVSQKRSSNGHIPAVLHLANIKMGRLLRGDELQLIVNYYKLDGKDALRTEGMPGYPAAQLLSLWEGAGLPLGLTKDMAQNDDAHQTDDDNESNAPGQS